MRDDVKQLLNKLQDIMNHTLVVLHDIRYNNSQIEYYIKTENHPSLITLIEENNTRLDTLSSLRFDTAAVKDQLSSILQVSPDGLHTILGKEKIPEWEAVRQKENEIHNIMELVVKQNDDLVENMESLKNSIKKDIRSLNITLKWHEKKGDSL